MSSFSKKYYNPESENDFYFITWETGYKNLKVYQDGKLVFTVDKPSDLMKGVKSPLPDGNTIQLNFTSERPLQLEVKVGKIRYYADNQLKDLSYIMNGISRIFWVLFGLGCIGTLFTFNQLWEFLIIPSILAIVLIDTAIVILYGVSAYLVNKGYVWPYFVSTSVFILTSIWAVLQAASALNLVVIIVLGIRIGIIIMLLFQFNKVLTFMKTKREINPEILDSIDKDLAEL